MSDDVTVMDRFPPGHSGHLLMWHMGYMTRTVEEWITQFGRERAEEMCRSGFFSVPEAVACLETAFGK